MKSWFKKFLLQGQTQKNSFQNKDHDFIYRLVDYFYCEKRLSMVLLIQLVNTRETRQMLPKDLLADDEIVRSMSQENIRLITYLECKQIFSHGYKIENHFLEKDFNQSCVEVRNLETNLLERRRILDIVGNAEFINKLQANDAFNLGCLTGTASIMSERIPE